MSFLTKPFSLSAHDLESALNRKRFLLSLAQSNPLTLFLLRNIYNRGNKMNKKLSVVVDGIRFENPLIVAAGWDKIGKNLSALHALGFAGVEVGSIVAYPQPGNPRPRFFEISPGVSLNSFGFNSPGMESVARNLEKYRKSSLPIGINIGKNKYIPNKAAPELYSVVVRRLYPFAKYFVINVSSPNSPHLRKLQEKKLLGEILESVLETMKHIGGRKPLFVKIAPELTIRDIDDVIAIVMEYKLTGIIATNTSSNEHLRAKYGHIWEEKIGGVSGDDEHYRKVALKQVAYIYKKTKGKIKIIGVGGIIDGATAIERIQAGASLIQIFSAIQSQGFSVARKINEGILAYMKKEKIKSIKDLVGRDYKKWIN